MADSPIAPRRIPDLSQPAEVEALVRRQGWSRVAGVDEAGRGPLAGPVVAAAVILPPGIRLPGVDDSKRLAAARREALYEEIQAAALAIAVEMVDPATIDCVNILEASRLAMRRAVGRLSPLPEVALIDGLAVPGFPVEQLPLVGGDGRSISIAAASIIAKVTRDRLMDALHEAYPPYGFARHKGYGTPEHLEQLRRHGPCPAHRRSFAPVRACLPPDSAGF